MRPGWSPQVARLRRDKPGKSIGAIRREDIKASIAPTRRKRLSASRIGCVNLVISAVLAETVCDRKLAESPCVGIQPPGVVAAADFILPARAQVEAVAVGLDRHGVAMHGCGRLGGRPIGKVFSEAGQHLVCGEEFYPLSGHPLCREVLDVVCEQDVGRSLGLLAPSGQGSSGVVITWPEK